MKNRLPILASFFSLFGCSANQKDLKTDMNKHNIESQNYPISQIKRTRILEGTFVYSVINNGGSYFMIDLPVYEDGVFDCWENVDIDGLNEKISKGWLTPQIPNNEYFGIHHLGYWKIKNANWNYNKENYADYLVSRVKQMNPEMQNLFNSYGKSSKVVGNINYSSFGSSEQLIRKDSEKLSFQDNKGNRTHYFFKHTDDVYYLASVNIYNDSIILIEGIPNNIKCDIHKIKSLAEQKILVTELPINSIVNVQNLGTFEILESRYNSNIEDKISELDDILARLTNKPTSSDICSDIYKEYENNPSTKLKKQLKEAYEKIPKHLRIYVLGDMDAKDWPIREIIYGVGK
jgi:hypothetical protein